MQSLRVLMKGEEPLVKRYKRYFNACMDITRVPKDWRGAYIVYIYKGKEGKNE